MNDQRPQQDQEELRAATHPRWMLDPKDLPSEGLSKDPQLCETQLDAMYRFVQWHGIDRYFAAKPN